MTHERLERSCSTYDSSPVEQDVSRIVIKTYHANGTQTPSAPPLPPS